ncbi:YHS domain protein [Bacillus methanolicus PB1]|uniref:YHS domain protein n=1 Tax=Bacillus methanolicus PB1 TaxID=997296 RepID=I3DV79_BACMT|nr:YHS domain protein [Bacillus methanolicus PB1]
MDERVEPYVMVTVVRRVRPSSATVGDKAIVTANGEMKGFVGGHCTRELIVGQAHECLRTGEKKLLLVTPQPPANVEEGVTVLSMTCASEGTVELFLEPKHVDPLLIIVGDFPIAHSLKEMAPQFAFVPRQICLEEVGNNSSEDPLEILRNQLASFKYTTAYGVVATMGLYDSEALLALSRWPLRYLGLVTSPKRWKTVRSGLEVAGAPKEFIDFVTAPAGLDIGAVGAQEVALSILAQIVERRRRDLNSQWEGLPEVKSSTTDPLPSDDGYVKISPKVVDPVCGMTVDLEKTQFRFELDGTIYGFCCSGCRNRFAKDPETYLSHA